MLETSKMPQSSSESESIMDKEDDVKVCDICGDAGQEDLLAICSRCIDGAEHVYCMRTMLDGLPDGDWFCEDCKFKEEYKDRKEHKFPTIIKTQEQSCLGEDAQDARKAICSEILLKKMEGAINLEDMVVSKRHQNAELYDENLDVNIHISEMASTENPVAIKTSIPQVMSLLSPEDPFNNPDILINRTSNPEQFSASCSIFEGHKAHTSSGSISSAGRDGSDVVSGPPIKSSSFKTTSAKPKVKKLLEAVPLVGNATGKFASKTTRKGVLIGQMVKSASFKTGKEGCSNFELDIEKSSVNNVKQIEDLRVEREKELRKNSSKVDLFQVEDARISIGSVFEYNAGDNRENPLHSSRNSASSSSSLLNLEHQIGYHFPEYFQPHGSVANNSPKPDPFSQSNNHLTSESSHQDDVTNVVTSSIALNKPLSCGDRTLCCQICNEASHPTHLCSIDKHSVSAIMLSMDRLPRQNANKSNKWKATGERIISKQAVLNCTNITNQSKELPIPSFGYSAKVVNKELPPQCFKKACFREGRTNATSGFVFDKSGPAVHLHEIHSNPGAEKLNQFGDISREFMMKPSEQILSSTELCISNTLKASAIPKFEFFWQQSV